MGRLAHSLSWSISIALVLTLALPAWADNKKEANKHFRAGLQLIEQRDFTSAAREFETSIELYPTKNALFNLANCYKVLYQYGEALVAIDKLKRLFRQDLDKDWIQEVATLEQDLVASMARLEIRVDVVGAAVLVDGKKVGESPLSEPLSLPPGAHKIEIIHKEHGTSAREVTLEKKSETVENFALLGQEPKLESQSEPEPVEIQAAPARQEKKRTWTWVSLGVGGAGLVGAIVTGALASSKAKTVKSHCDGKTCDPEYRDEHVKAANLGITANVFTGVAIAGVALGAVLFFVEGKHKEREKTALSVVPAWSANSAGVQLVGTF